MEIENLYKHTKIKVVHHINTSSDVHIELVKARKKRQRTLLQNDADLDQSRYTYENKKYRCNLLDALILTGYKFAVIHLPYSLYSC